MMADKVEEKVKIIEKVHKPKVKPVLGDEVKVALGVRKEKKAVKPPFKRQEWFRYKKLGTSWRRARGVLSKVRRGFKYRPKKVKIGFGGPKLARELHPTGFKEVMVYNPADLAKIDPKIEGARIGGTVGGRKRKNIIVKADGLGIKVFNRGGL